MQFNSYTFLLFFGLVLAIHRSPIPWRAKKANLLVASYLFYAAWSPPFVILLWASTLVDWFVSRAIDRSTTPIHRKGLVLVSLAVNLGVLGYFKYGGFLLENFVTLVHAFGVDFQPAAPNIILPVGISFYTFQTLSYTLDVYRRNAKPWSSFLDYALYVTFFPQLVAGPIVRSIDFLPQCRQETHVSGEWLGRGLTFLILGLFMKVVVADGLMAPVVEKVFDGPGVHGFASAWVGTLAFSGQIFCDFAGYSTCAIGIALCLGWVLPVNFRFPYAAAGFSDFWRRWHISLSTWLRDYLYITLGGNRHGEIRTKVNLMVTMLLGGLWHGASWNFVIWGFLHGLFLIVERPFLPLINGSAVMRSLPLRILHILLTFALVCLAWVFFRATTLEKAMAMIEPMLLGNTIATPMTLKTKEVVTVLLTTTCLLLIHFVMRDVDYRETIERSPWWLRSFVLALMMVAIVTMPGHDRSFIYFQF